MKTIDWMQSVYACSGASDWVGKRTLKQAWDECERADWLLWAATMAGVDRKKIVLAAVDCAIAVLPFDPDPLIETCINVVEAWARGDATLEQVAAAAEGGSVAWYGIGGCSDSQAAAAVTYAISRAARDADYVAYADPKVALRDMCVLVRDRISTVDFIAAIKQKS